MFTNYLQLIWESAGGEADDQAKVEERLRQGCECGYHCLRQEKIRIHIVKSNTLLRICNHLTGPDPAFNLHLNPDMDQVAKWTLIQIEALQNFPVPSIKTW